MRPLKLYHLPLAPPSRGALLVARYLGLDVEIREVDLFACEHLQDWFVRINPQHTVPTLDDNGFVLWESRAIATYLVDTRAPGSPLYPLDPQRRARVDQRLYFDATKLFPRTRDIAQPVLAQGETRISEERKQALYEALDLLEGFLAQSKWVAGEELSVADLSILATVSGVFFMGAKLEKYPNIRRWFDNCQALPGYQENEAGAKQLADAVKAKLVRKSL